MTQSMLKALVDANIELLTQEMSLGTLVSSGKLGK